MTMSCGRGTSTLAIVVPAPTASERMEETLVSILENRPDDCEIVVALGFRYDDRWGIGEEVRFVQAPVGSGLVTCANLGIASTAAPVVHLLAAGWRATPGWTDAAVARLASGEVAAVVPVTVAAEDRERPVAAGIRVTRGGRRLAVAAQHGPLDVSTAEPDGPCLEAGFWRAEVLAAVGPGFAPICGESHADADMARALAVLGARVELEPESRVVAGPARRRAGAFADALHAERVFWRSLTLRTLPVACVPHAAEVMRHAVMAGPVGTVPALVGRAVGFFQYGSMLRRVRELAAVAAEWGATEAERSAELLAGTATNGGMDGGMDGGMTVRIDGPHAGVSRPRGEDHEATPLRRSA
jgi:hypothetical protein